MSDKPAVGGPDGPEEPKKYRLQAEPGEFVIAGADVHMTVGNIAVTAHAPVVVTLEVSAKALRPIADGHPMVPLIGSVAVHWSQFEHELDSTIWTLLGGDERRLAVLTSQVMGAANKLAVIDLLCAQQGLAQQKSDCNAIQNKVVRAQQQRNRVVHDPWYVEIDSQEVYRAQKMDRTDRAFGHVATSEGDLAGLISSITEMVAMTRGLRDSIDLDLP